MSTRTRVILAIAAGTAVLIAAGYLLLPRPHEDYRGPVEAIRFGVETSILSAPVWVAQAKGYFRDEGIDAQIRDFDSGRTAMRTMLVP